ncbi:MAG: M20/M25/M40 family metallo-hydrolase [Deltaproteobacteria bacterium]|nr:M20/M25/M40 family metallo-hydrolase [Deltaproteobacteria bacterium]
MSWNLIEEAKKIIGIRSLTNEGTRALAEHLVPLCRQAGLQITLRPPSKPTGFDELNLIAHTVPDGSEDLCPNGLLMVTHLDTVPAGDPALWTETSGKPFQATIKGDKIYGLGSADTKLDFLCKLKAIEEVGVKNIKIPLCLVGSYGEERALAGIKELRLSGRVKPRFALIGEPSELKPVLKHKGILYMQACFDLKGGWLGSGARPRATGEHGWAEPETGPALVKTNIFHGRAAHGSTPHLGENAIFKAFEWLFEEQKKNPLIQLAEINGGTVHNIVPETCMLKTTSGEKPCPRIEFLKTFWGLYQTAQERLGENTDSLFDPPITTGNVGVLKTKEDRIEMEFDFRLIPATNGNELFEIFQKISHLSGASLEVISSNPPMDTSERSEIVRHVSSSLKEIGLPVEFHAKAGNTEGAIVSQMGAEAIVIGPGRSTGNIHKPNESNEISQLKKAVEFYGVLLRRFC